MYGQPRLPNPCVTHGSGSYFIVVFMTILILSCLSITCSSGSMVEGIRRITRNILPVHNRTKFFDILFALLMDRVILVVRSQFWSRRVLAAKPDSTEDPPCIEPATR
ncbi:hypothetical protein AVEN_72989-1 [Araneus ventricosus]|uniref:Uncharacterized protein n=1 Tax=Araneus ventricosus TaxID=182803 RepID=A0A4Y2HEI9_ARAVE|nr:hypothetical protein AVEN_72989-1 [Araneus ventricosus]